MPPDLFPVTATAADACCSPTPGPTMDATDAERTARTLKALADPARLRLLSIIAAHDGGEACVCDLTEPVGLTQPTVSHHLKVLTEAGFVTREKRGVWAYYTLVPDAVRALTAHLGAHLLDGPGA
ncbi:ArsR/SmtB family transcription factor [Cellulomonas iranensis]|uniref:ArsR/SmtB family transcription factor n=1 Tax=Cellulomonas iranensis TaxID=76862 RepID=UPI0013D1FDC0|nr:metalloregulator ArsR/SmtB family transcription factor [Cellulomonas iranensis]